MAHGNFSDLVFLALFAVVVQWWAFPATLFEDLGPLKAQFSIKSADMDALIKFGGGMLLMIALTFSGVSWNEINGKMAGLGGFIAAGVTAYSTFKADSDVFVPRLFYVYALVLFLGALHIFAFPSNLKPPKNDSVKNNHGNFSDIIALGLIVASCLCYFYPDHLFQDTTFRALGKEFGPVKAQFSTKSADLTALIKFVAGLMLMIGLTFSSVKWNPDNGKMAGLGGFIAAGVIGHSTFNADSEVFVLRAFYIYAALLGLGALHIFAFPLSIPFKSPREFGQFQAYYGKPPLPEAHHLPPASCDRGGGWDGGSSQLGSSSPAVGRRSEGESPHDESFFRVVIRVRPPLDRELTSPVWQNVVSVSHQSQVCLHEVIPEASQGDRASGTNQVVTNHTFAFDHVYDQDASQPDVYACTARASVMSALQGYNATILAYGPTGTGKTYTMEGSRWRQPHGHGIIPRSMEDIFVHISQWRNPQTRFTVRASYLQIYNEVISDLLKPDRSHLVIRE
ncbi:unnamed protein product, partial [Polarella glacialis]